MTENRKVVKLFRWDTGTPWGFKLNGGFEYLQPLYVQTVAPKSLSYRSGLRPGDGIILINGEPSHDMTYLRAKQVILRHGNDVTLTVERDSINVSKLHPELAIGRTDHVIDDIEKRFRGYPGPGEDPSIKSRTFRNLQAQLS